MESAGQTAVVFGATGLVGYELVKTLLDSHRYTTVVAVTRRLLPLTNPALEQLVLADYGQLMTYKDSLNAAVYFCCIGTTLRKAGSRLAFRKVDYDIPCHIAELAEALAIPAMIVISSLGASIRTTNFYLRTKGEMELAVRERYTGRLVFVRPSLLIGFRQEVRIGESLGVVFMRLFGWLLTGRLARFKGIGASQVAAAMMTLAGMANPDRLYETDELFYLAKGIEVLPSKKALAKHRKINLRLILIFACLVVLAAYLGHQESIRHRQFFGDLPDIQARGELRALTLYSSTSYFLFKDKEMGYEYELCEQLATSLGLKLRMIVVPNILALMDSLEAGAGDIIAYNVPLSQSIKSDFLPCGREFLTHQVLVQRRDNPDLVTDVTELPGKEVVVQRGTRYHTRLTHLNEELGGGLLIKVLDEDSITAEDLIGQVAAARINFTVADNVQAQFNKTYYKNLHISTRLSFPQHSFWLVRKESPLLAAAVNAWFVANVSSSDYKAINKRYFERSKGPSPFLTTGRFIAPDGSLSPYDALFKRLGGEHGLDWRLLASIAYQESKFDAQVVSWAGAVGLMQLMPRTAESYGVDADSLTYPEHNVLAAVRLLNSLERPFRKVATPEDRHKLALAAFNSGLGHVLDARALARKYGKNPDSWNDVCEYLLLKRLPAYYEDPVCKQGYLRGNETADFVTEVWTRYQYYLEKGVK